MCGDSDKGAAFKMPEILNPEFRGRIRVKTHEDLFVSFSLCPYGGGLIDYGGQGTLWDVEPSPLGGFYISTDINGRKCFWLADMMKRNIIKLDNWCESWQSFRVQQHPSGSGFAFWNVGMQRFLCAEPASHGIHLIADRSAAGMGKVQHRGRGRGGQNQDSK